jgi:hypothetical protein
MAFTPARSHSDEDVRYVMIDNSQTLSVGEAIITGIQGDVSVCLTAGGTDGAVLGVVVGFKQEGNVLEMNAVTAENDNVTDKMIKAAYIPSYLQITWYGDLDAAAETTDNSGCHGNFTVDSTGLLVDESSVSTSFTVENMQLFSFGLTGKDTTQVECRWISTIFGYDIA